MPHQELHHIHRSAPLRAIVMGANDGIISTSSLIIGIASAGAEKETIFLSGLLGLVAGSLSMAAGEYVSVSSQKDIEQADIDRERIELKKNPENELLELEQIYRDRGLEPSLAKRVAFELSREDPLKAHLRDELGITEINQANPLMAALLSALAFFSGAVLTLIPISITETNKLVFAELVSTGLILLLLGAVASSFGGASKIKGAVRVFFWGLLAMGLSHLIGRFLSI